MSDPIRAGRIKKVLRQLEPPMPVEESADPLITDEEIVKKRKRKRKKEAQSEMGIDEPAWTTGDY